MTVLGLEGLEDAVIVCRSDSGSGLVVRGGREGTYVHYCTSSNCKYKEIDRAVFYRPLEDFLLSVSFCLRCFCFFP